jgi:hypothetical protein
MSYVPSVYDSSATLQSPSWVEKLSLGNINTLLMIKRKTVSRVQTLSLPRNLLIGSARWGLRAMTGSIKILLRENTPYMSSDETCTEFQTIEADLESCVTSPLYSGMGCQISRNLRLREF